MDGSTDISRPFKYDPAARERSALHGEVHCRAAGCPGRLAARRGDRRRHGRPRVYARAG